MKVVVILGGLGSQMFKYAFYLRVKERYGAEECYISTLPYYMNTMWNGYELANIFHIKEPDFVQFLTPEDYERLKEYKRGYGAFTLGKMGELHRDGDIYHVNRGKIGRWDDRKSIAGKCREKMKNAVLYLSDRIHPDENAYLDVYDEAYLDLDGTVLYDEFNHTSDQYIHSDSIDLKEIFQFPDFNEEKNKLLKQQMCETESVAVHIRRSDHMYDNAELFENGYFQSAVRYIRENAATPIFYVFSEEAQWCRNHLGQLGIKEGEVCIVDWNTGRDSFRDMQLMTFCKHNILVKSSFSWWGYYLSRYENKLVCAPKGYWFEVPIHL